MCAQLEALFTATAAETPRANDVPSERQAKSSTAVGATVGMEVGVAVGAKVGTAVGAEVGTAVGDVVGAALAQLLHSPRQKFSSPPWQLDWVLVRQNGGSSKFGSL